jgi:hypothetical protein
MLQAELSGAAFSKSAHNQDLRPKLNNRSKGSEAVNHSADVDVSPYFMVGQRVVPWRSPERFTASQATGRWKIPTAAHRRV